MATHKVQTQARCNRYVIGGIDYSAQVLEFSGSDRHLVNFSGGAPSPSGIISFQGSLTLSGGSGPLPVNNWETDNLNDGRLLIIETQDEAGNVVRHPRGSLRIVGSSFDEEANEASLDLACLLGAKAFKTPPDQFLSQVEPGSVKSMQSVVLNLLTAAGITNVQWNAAVAYNFRDRPKLSGSALESAGKMLASAGAYMWIDKNEVCQIDSVSDNADNPLWSGYAYELVDFKRVRVGKPIAQRLKVTGSYNLVFERETPTNRTETERGPRIHVDGNTGESSLLGERLVRRTTYTDNLDFNRRSHTITERTDLSNDTVYRGWEGFPNTFGLKTNAEVSTKRIDYEASDSARRLRQRAIRSQVRALALAPFLDALYELDRDLWAGQAKVGDIDAERIYETFEYNSRDMLIRHERVKEAPLASILAQLGDPDWVKVAELVNPSDQYIVEKETTTWEENLPDDWTPKTNRWVAAAYDADFRAGVIQAIAEAVQNADYLRAYAAARQLYKQTDEGEPSNTGNGSPPAPERMPAQFRSEGRQLEAYAIFPVEATNWTQNEATMAIPYLPDRRGGVLTSNPSGPVAFASDYAQIWGGVALSMHRTARVQMPLFDGLLDYRPWAAIRVGRGGKVYRLAMNGTSWAADRDQCLVSTDGALLGTEAGATLPTDPATTVTPPYQTLTQVVLGMTIGVVATVPDDFGFTQEDYNVGVLI